MSFVSIAIAGIDDFIGREEYGYKDKLFHELSKNSMNIKKDHSIQKIINIRKKVNNFKIEEGSYIGLCSGIDK